MPVIAGAAHLSKPAGFRLVGAGDGDLHWHRRPADAAASVIGLHSDMRRLAQKAVPVQAPWADGTDVRVSPLVSGPVTFGSTILLPPEHSGWDVAKRWAVLAHEGAHVRQLRFLSAAAGRSESRGVLVRAHLPGGSRCGWRSWRK